MSTNIPTEIEAVKKSAAQIVKDATQPEMPSLFAVDAESIILGGILESTIKMIIYPYGKKPTGQNMEINGKSIPVYKMHTSLPPYIELKAQYGKIKISALDLLHLIGKAREIPTFQRILSLNKDKFRKELEQVDLDAIN